METEKNPITRGRGRPKGRGLNENSPFTDKQKRFVDQLVDNDGTITKRQAAINAGYSEKSAHAKAYELTNPNICPHVVAEIRKKKIELDEKFGITFSRHVRDLQRIRDIALENGAYSAAVQAEYRRGQAQGNIYVNKSEIRHGSIDSMSREEVEKALQELKNSYGDNVINITPSEAAKQIEEARVEAISGFKEISEKESIKVSSN